jgi:hypothetical protein
MRVRFFFAYQAASVKTIKMPRPDQPGKTGLHPEKIPPRLLIENCCRGLREADHNPHRFQVIHVTS